MSSGWRRDWLVPGAVSHNPRRGDNVDELVDNLRPSRSRLLTFASQTKWRRCHPRQRSMPMGDVGEQRHALIQRFGS